MNPKDEFPEAYELCKRFMLGEDQMIEVIDRMTKEINMGLARDTHARSVIKCYVSHVQDLPTGQERGKFLALDLGGTHFRVLLVTLINDFETNIESKTYIMEKSLISGPGGDLFDFLAECLANFCKDHHVEGDNLPLGFTFSFPLRQNGLANGVLTAWTKGFSCDGVVGKNVVQLLEEAIARRKDLKINIVAILNDTVGTLMSCAYLSRNCRIGLIVGTGTNACYVEKTANAEMFQNYQTSSKPYMIINCEWGAFGDNGVLDFIKTPFDKLVDKQTPNVNRQTFEKCISGMYLGELVRLILIDLIGKGVLFKGHSSEFIFQKWSFQTSFISEVESDAPGQYRNASLVLDKIGVRQTTEFDKRCLRFICETVSTRAAKLTACGLVCLINKMNASDVTIGVDGGVYRFHPKFHDILVHHVSKLLRPGFHFRIVLSEDGSGRGAALVAAAAVSNKFTKE
ncbi:hexokinase type 2 [Drosophila tropicalis]|uniref:hexokinase type 2 n=1 Tax=Drosophila tropicalis TaxID=46794 RepID=UPI0035AB6842